MIRRLISALFRPGAIFPIPAGQVPDATGANGLIGLMNNVNAYSQDMSSYATTTAVALVVGDILNGIIQLNTGAGGGFNVTLPTTAQILGALGPSVPQDGSFTKIIRIVNNNSGQTATLVAGDAPTSIIGTASIATNVSRDYAMRVMQSALSFTNIGSLTL